MLALGLLLAIAGLADAPPEIDVYTMGEGDDLFSHFGHAAICVTDTYSPRGRCYNYGTADFSTSRVVVGCGEAKQVLAVS